MDIKDELNEAIRLLEGIRSRIDSESLLANSGGHTPKISKNAQERILVLAVGHSRELDAGAVAYDSETYEWHYNTKLAHKIKEYLPSHINTTIINHYEGDSYTESMRWLKKTVDPLNADLVCELHFNSFSNPNVKGHEMLHWNSSLKGLIAATNINDAMNEDFPGNTDRGVKKVTHGERGAGFLYGPKAPCVIIEPFFGSNPDEWEAFGETETTFNALAKTLARGISITLSYSGTNK